MTVRRLLAAKWNFQWLFTDETSRSKTWKHCRVIGPLWRESIGFVRLNKRWNKEWSCQVRSLLWLHDDVIKLKHFPCSRPFVREIHWSPVNFPHKGQWRGALIHAWNDSWANNGDTGELRRYRGYYDLIVMLLPYLPRYNQLLRNFSPFHLSITVAIH